MLDESQPALRKAVLIGAGSPIGADILARLSAAGCETLSTWHRNSAGMETGRTGKSVQLDLASAESTGEFLDVLNRFGAPDALINVAGYANEGLCMSANAQSLQRINAINYMHPALISSRAASLMAPRRHGYIVHITSAAARRARIGNAAYGAAKIALERFMASLALEVARFRIRTLCVAPAFVDTPMFATYAGARREEILRSIPMRRILAPMEVADVVIQFVEGKLAATGTVLPLGNGENVFT